MATVPLALTGRHFLKELDFTARSSAVSSSWPRS